MMKPTSSKIQEVQQEIVKCKSQIQNMEKRLRYIYSLIFAQFQFRNPNLNMHKNFQDIWGRSVWNDNIVRDQAPGANPRGNFETSSHTQGAIKI